MQAAEGLSNITIDSLTPAKIDLVPEVPKDQYGNEKARPIVGIPDLKKDAKDAVEEATHSVASTLRPEEASEPILRENPNRFVLFPIKYNEVCSLDASGRVRRPI